MAMPKLQKTETPEKPVSPEIKPPTLNSDSDLDQSTNPDQNVQELHKCPFGRGEIYCIINLQTGEKYIGQTGCMKLVNGRYKYLGYLDRFQTHLRNAMSDSEIRNSQCPKFYKAIRQYGPESFSVSLLEECSLSEMNKREKYYIKFYQTRRKGYNVTTGGQRKRRTRRKN